MASFFYEHILRQYKLYLLTGRCIWLNWLLNGEKSVTKEYLTPDFFIL